MKTVQNLLSITDHDFDNFGGKKVVIWTILTLFQSLHHYQWWFWEVNGKRAEGALIMGVGSVGYKVARTQKEPETERVRKSEHFRYNIIIYSFQR